MAFLVMSEPTDANLFFNGIASVATMLARQHKPTLFIEKVSPYLCHKLRTTRGLTPAK
jgi:hypothetical protein